KVRLRYRLPVEAVNPADACNRASLGIPPTKYEVFIAYFEELATGNFEFHQKGMGFSACPFRRVRNIQRKIYIRNHYGLAVRRPCHLGSKNRYWRIEQELTCSCRCIDQLVLEDACVASVRGGMARKPFQVVVFVLA